MHARRIGPLLVGGHRDVTPAEAVGDGDGINLGAVIAALTEENNRLSRQLERERRGVWREAHGLRLDRARSAFDQALSRLRRLEPRAVDGAAPLQLNETVLNGLRRCDQAP